MGKKVSEIEAKSAKAADAVEQIEKLNRMIEMHIHETQDDLMIEQYSTLRYRMIEKLAIVLESLHLKVEDTAHYVERFRVEQKVTENGLIQELELAEAELVH